MRENYYAVIMAGGGGTRLWPLSRKSRPKQVLDLIDERSLFQTAVDRLEGLFSPEQIVVVTISSQVQSLIELCPQIPVSNFLIEPMPRGTASAIGLAAIFLRRINKQSVMAVLTADHIILDENRFRKLLVAAYEIAQKSTLVTLGIEPTSPATGYGYIQIGDIKEQLSGFSIYNVQNFKEKPVKEQAEEMIRSQDHLWNSGMFVWQVDDILNEIQLQMPALMKTLNKIDDGYNASSGEENSTIGEVWSSIAPQTIDYGIMEGAKNVAVIRADGLGWSDIGSWDALYDVMPSDTHGNIVIGNQPVLIDSHNSLVLNKDPQRLIAAIGVKDLIIVDTGDVLLICQKEKSQHVRLIVNQLKSIREDLV